MLGGSLLCIVPGGQPVGAFFVALGAGAIMEGLASGEVPYKVDTNTGYRYHAGGYGRKDHRSLILWHVSGLRFPAGKKPG